MRIFSRRGKQRWRSQSKLKLKKSMKSGVWCGTRESPKVLRRLRLLDSWGRRSVSELERGKETVAFHKVLHVLLQLGLILFIDDRRND